MTVRRDAFIDKRTLRSVRFNSCLETLGNSCFANTGLETLVLPASVTFLEDEAFVMCRRLKRADLANARKLKILGQGAFSACGALQNVILGDGLETIGDSCFTECALIELTIPRNVKTIGNGAFHSCRLLKQVAFAGNALLTIGEYAFTESGLQTFTAPPSLRRIGESAFADCLLLKRVDLSACLAGNKNDGDTFLARRAFEFSGVEDVRLPPQLQVIGERAFAGCKGLREIIFDKDAVLEEIRMNAFYGSGLESFRAPSSLEKIGGMAFGRCRHLTYSDPNDNIQEFGYLSLWGTGISYLKLPPRIQMTQEQLGLGQKNLRTVILPDGLAAVEDHLFEGSDIEQVVVSSSVKEFKKWAFGNCEQLHDIVFTRDSCLESIGNNCFTSCGFASVVIPRSVRSIGHGAFSFCARLSSLVFEEGSQLQRVGTCAFGCTALESEQLRYPNGVEEDKSGDESLSEDEYGSASDLSEGLW